MRSFETRRVVRHAASNMFDLVADIDEYPKFVPLCEAIRVRGRKPLENGREILVADMTVAYKMIRETFTTKVTMDRTKAEILVEYLDGPVSELENRWQFIARGEAASEVVFHLTYEFKSRVFAAVMGAIFDRAFKSFAEAFERRADAVYGVAS